MNFDPALAAQCALRQASERGELGHHRDAVLEAEEIFSSSAGAEARDAYDRLIDFGRRCPDAYAFKAFLIYITWQQVTEETIPEHFRRGMELCERFLAAGVGDAEERARIADLGSSFRAGLGLDEADGIEEFEQDAFKGGD